MRKTLLLAVIFFGTITSVLAQVDDSEFRIRVFGGQDTLSPTTPTLLTIDPIAYNQIDLTWSLSTDNFSVSGYTLSRDGNVIATTTQLNYSDTGLTASTTYGYTVRAFDASYNYSTSSNILSTTTPDIPVVIPPVDPGSSQASSEGTYARVILKELSIDVGKSTTSLNIKTNGPSRIELRWGRTADYELGYIVGNVFRTSHSFLLSDLEPNTTYDYEIVAYTPSGAKTILTASTFTTASDKFVTSPSNVNRFLAVGRLSDVDLSWQNPSSENIAYVRIVRSHFGYPTHPTDGAVVYQGLKNKFIDEDILSQYSPVYYTAFVYDKNGNVSSGAIAMAYSFDGNSDDKKPTTGKPIDFVELPKIIDEPSREINKDRLTPEMKMPELSEISIIQAGKKFSMMDTGLIIDSKEDFVVLIPADSVAGNLKSIILTILDPTDNRQAYSYLMRINNNRTAYIAVVSPLGVLGDSQIRVEVFDYEAFMVGTYQAPIKFIDSAYEKGKSLSIDYLKLFFDRINSILLLSALVLSVIFIFLYKRRKNTEDNN